ncbi:hypothetical protein TCAL_12191, partial [Tigriopus californicus]
MAEEVSQNKADLILSPLSSTHKREKLIDYSMAITENQLVLISKKTTFNPPLLNIWVYFDPFKSMVWLVMISVVIVTSFMLFVMNFEVKSICILFTHILALLIQRPLDLDLTQTSSKLLQLFIAIWALFIFVTYNGNLTSTMTIQSPPPEIDTLEEILAQKRHLVMWRSTVLTDRYENASKGTLKNRVWEYLINADYQSFITSSDELMDLFQKDPRLIYFGEVLELTPITDYEFIPVKFESKAILAFGLAKESAIRCLFDYRLLKLRNLGIFHKLYYKWIDPNARDVANMEVYPFGFENVVFPFAVLGVGELFNDEADIIASTLSVTTERNKVIDFSIAILGNPPVLVTKLLQDLPPVMNLWVYFDPFTWEAWLALAFAIGILLLAFLCLSSFEIRLGPILSQILGLLIQRQMELPFIQIPARLLHFYIALLALFVFTAYNGNLTSTMTVQGPPPGVETLEEILAQKQHLVVWRSTAISDRYKNSLPGTIKNQIWEYLIHSDYQSFITSAEDLSDLFQREPRIIYLGERLDVYPSFDFHFTEVEFEPKAYSAFGFQKDSDIKCMFDFQLLKLMNLGIFDKLRIKWLEEGKAASKRLTL